MNHTELVMRRRNVLAFVNADPVRIELKRPSPAVKTDAGGSVRGEPTLLTPQTARIIPSKRRYDHGLVNTEPGQLPHTDYLLIAVYTFDGQVDDWFQWRGDNYQIKGIRPLIGEDSFLAAIDFYGKNNV